MKASPNRIMNPNTLKHILLTGSTDEIQDAFTNIRSELLTEEIFTILCGLLNHSEDRYRFFALYYLINKFYDHLIKADQQLVDTLYELLFDKNHTVIDRTIWALGIVGDKALDKLISEYQMGSMDVKRRIVYAVGRGNFSHKTKERIEILLDGLKSTDTELRFIAMSELMSNSPLSPWEVEYDGDIDFLEIYASIKPVALAFTKSEEQSKNEFATRYLDWLENKNT